jgi:hypothetical protein
VLAVCERLIGSSIAISEEVELSAEEVAAVEANRLAVRELLESGSVTPMPLSPEQEREEWRIITTLGPGGAEAFIRRAADMAIKAGLNPDLFTLD